MTRADGFGLTDRDRVGHLRRSLELMSSEARHREALIDRLTIALREIALDPNSGPYGDIALEALRPKRAPPTDE